MAQKYANLSWALILNDLANKYATNNIRLYRDDRVTIFRNRTLPQVERTRKEILINKALQGIRTEDNNIQSNFKSVDYLDITLNLANGRTQHTEN